MRAVLNKILYNFWLRNMTLLVLLMSMDLFQNIAMGKPWEDNIKALLLNVLFFLLCLLHNTVLYRRLLLQGRYAWYICLLLVSILAFQIVLTLGEYLALNVPPPEHTIVVWLSVLWVDLIYMALGFAIYYSITHFKEKNDLLNLEYLRRDLELKQLKEQLNPHFIFNALNNIYSYSIENKNTGELILKLSELIRTMVTDSSLDSVPIGREAAFVANYIAFEQERLGDRCKVEFVQTIDDAEKPVVPFVFLALLENTFKHGANTIGQSEIYIALHSEKDSVRFNTLNTMGKAYEATSGLGLINMQRRLQLCYPGRHTLQLQQAEGWYKAELTLGI